MFWILAHFAFLLSGKLLAVNTHSSGPDVKKAAGNMHIFREFRFLPACPPCKDLLAKTAHANAKVANASAYPAPRHLLAGLEGGKSRKPPRCCQSLLQVLIVKSNERATIWRATCHHGTPSLGRPSFPSDSTDEERHTTKANTIAIAAASLRTRSMIG